MPDQLPDSFCVLSGDGKMAKCNECGHSVKTRSETCYVQCRRGRPTADIKTRRTATKRVTTSLIGQCPHRGEVVGKTPCQCPHASDVTVYRCSKPDRRLCSSKATTMEVDIGGGATRSVQVHRCEG